MAFAAVAFAAPALAGDPLSPFADDAPPPPMATQRARTPAAAPSDGYWRPVVRPWHTIVVPAPVDRRVTTGSLPPVAPATPAAAATPPAPNAHATSPPATARPLTGYAHELGGIASYYWQDQMTSSGERFDRRGLTAAHKTLPLGTRVRVTNLANGRSIVVRINDRGPFKGGRVIDLSEAAAEQIAMTGAGLARVALEVVR